MKRPRISVVLALYNGEAHLQKQLSSILSQLTEDDELLIMDDGSTDAGPEMVRALARKNAQIKLVAKEHRGLIQNFARGIALASGEIIFLADQDDIWHPEKVSRVTQVLAKSGGPMLAMHDAQFVDDELHLLPQTLFTWRTVKTGFWRNWLRNPYMGCCLAFRVELKSVILPFPEELPMHDQWIGLLAERVGGVHFIREKLLYYRRHAHSVTNDRHQSLQTMVLWRVRLLKQYVIRMCKLRRRGG